MEASGCVADVVAYNSVISGLARGGQWEDAWGILQSMTRAGVRPSTVTYNAVLAACERGPFLKLVRAYVNSKLGGTVGHQPSP